MIQFNKRDLPNILSVQEMNRLLNAPGLPFFEAVAVKGEGVLTTLTRITRVVADHLKQTLFAGPEVSASAAQKPSSLSGETSHESDRTFSDSSIQTSDSDTPAFLSRQSQAAPAPQSPEPHVFSQDRGITHSFEKSFEQKDSPKSQPQSLASASAPAAQSLQKDEIPSLGDLGEPLESTANQDSIPSLASVETTRPREAPSKKQTVVPLDRAAPADKVVPLERPTPVPVERTVDRDVSEPASPETSSKSYWVDPSLVTVSAEKLSAPESQKGVALRFGEPERESGNQVRIPVALRLKATNEIVSFQMVIRVEQEPDASS